MRPGKYPRLSEKDLNSSWDALTIHLLASWNDHLLTFVHNNIHENKTLWHNCLVLWLVSFKTMFLNSFSIENMWEFLKWHISQLVAPIEVLFVASPPEFGKLYNDVVVLSSMRWSQCRLLRNIYHKFIATLLRITTL